LFLNNPEQLIASDLGDPALGDKTVYRVAVGGTNRSFFEHVNRSGRTIGFGIQAYNAGTSTVRVKVVASGWVVGILGGAPFADLFAGHGSAPEVVLAPGRSTWLLRKDEGVAQGSFFSGVVDFDITGGELIINHIAYDSFAALDGSTSELGYVQRVEPDGTHEARMYKGIATASEADLGTLDCIVDDTTAGLLPVRVARYDLAAGAFLAPAVATGWTTHIGPAQNAAATTSDMVAIEDAPWRFEVLAASDGEGRPGNLGNWGVVYRTHLRVTNHGSVSRRVAYVISASPGAGAVIASSSGTAWVSARIEKGTTVELGAIRVAPGETRELEILWVLGGPSGGGIAHGISVDF